VTEVFNSNTIVNVDSLVFNPGAPSYTISAYLDNIELSGAGIVNNSGTTQFFVAGTFVFFNSATAGNMTSFTNVGDFIAFEDTSSAGSATIDLTDNMYQAHMSFSVNSTAAEATISASAGANIGFFDASTGGNATFNLTTEASVIFTQESNADHATGNCIGGDQYFGAYVLFQEFASAGEGSFTAFGGSTRGEKGGFVEFDQYTTADNATFVINGAMGAGLAPGTLNFYDTSTAATAKITAKGGKDGAKGGAIIFNKTSTGGTASISLTGNAELDISSHKAPGVTIGSLAGKGSVLLGANTLTIGSNNQSTAFSGVISGTGGVTKSGTGTLTLSGNNTYTGLTAVKGGVLVTDNKRGSATGTGNVNVNAGTLGGEGAISGPVTMGTGSGSGAFLTPSAAAKQPATLNLASTLIFNSDATYTCALQAGRKKAACDEVVANGVTIQSGAQFNLVAKVQGKLKPGASFTVLSNTASTPISGTFANLADGAVLTVGNAKLQASYEGGDGNDLTLTVVQ
jgi:autotransporter-associated beta strand protein